MKNRTVNKILIKAIAILVIIILCLISFCGIHKRNLNSWKNLVPEFKLSKELSQTRNYGFTVDDSTKTVEEETDENTDEASVEEEATGQTIEEFEESIKNQDNTEEAEATTETTEGVEVVDATAAAEEEEETPKKVPVNDPSVLTSDNYSKSKSIIEKRLKKYGTTDFNVSVNNKTGAINLSTAYTNNADSIMKLITSKGNIEIIDTDTNEVLISKKMISKAEPYYQQSSESTDDQVYYNLGIRLSFTSEGKKKFRELSKTHIETTDEDGNAVQKTITVQIDGDDGHKYTTWFMPDGNYEQLPMTLYQYVTADDMETFNSNYNECVIQSIIVNTDTLPIQYELTTGSYIESNLNKNFIKAIIIISIVIFAIITVLTIIKNRKYGIFITLIELAYIAVHLILIRIANVTLSLSGIITIILMALANYILIRDLYNQEKQGDKLETFGRFTLTIIPFIITMIVFTVLGKEINIQSIGMVGIWGIISFAITLLFSMFLLDKQNGKKNGVENHEK